MSCQTENLQIVDQDNVASYLIVAVGHANGERLNNLQTLSNTMHIQHLVQLWPFLLCLNQD